MAAPLFFAFLKAMTDDLSPMSHIFLLMINWPIYLYYREIRMILSPFVVA